MRKKRWYGKLFSQMRSTNSEYDIFWQMYILCFGLKSNIENEKFNFQRKYMKYKINVKIKKQYTNFLPFGDIWKINLF